MFIYFCRLEKLLNYFISIFKYFLFYIENKDYTIISILIIKFQRINFDFYIFEI